MKKGWIVSVVMTLLTCSGLAFAQTAVIPQAQVLHQNDLDQILPLGSPAQGGLYVALPAASAMEFYQVISPSGAGFVITPTNFVTFLLLSSSTTLATGGLFMEAGPADGQRFCVEDTGVQSAITISANTGQTLYTNTSISTPTNFAAGTVYCWLYVGTLAEWLRTR